MESMLSNQTLEYIETEKAKSRQQLDERNAFINRTVARFVDELKKKDEIIKKLLKVIEFYGEKSGNNCMWLPKSSSSMTINTMIDHDDWEDVSRRDRRGTEINYTVGGKHARVILEDPDIKKWREK